jgi:hypothetical protein
MEINLQDQFRIAKLIIFLIMLQLVIHIFNNSNLICVVLLAGTLLIGALLIFSGGVSNPLALMGFIFLARYIGIASVLKILLGQPLDSNLSVPGESFGMMLACAAQLYVAFLLVEKIRFQKPFLPPFNDPDELKTFSYLCTFFGLITMALMAKRPRNEPDLMGFYQFAENIYPMAIVARTAYVCQRSANAKIIDFQLLAMLGVGIAFSFLMGVKMMAFSCMLAYTMTLVCLKRSVPVKLLVVAGIGVSIVILVVTPIINTLRESQKMDDKTDGEKIVILVDFFKNQDLAQNAAAFARQEDIEVHYYDYFGQIGMFRPVAERVALIENSDALIRGINTNGYLGSYLVTEVFSRMLPRVFNPKKDMISTGDYIVWHAGASRRDSIGYPTVGIIGSSYAICGWPTVLCVPFILFTSFFATVKFISGSSCNFDYLWNIYILVIYGHEISECDVSSFIQLIIRVIPLDFAVFVPLFFLARSLKWFGVLRNLADR